MHRHGPRQEGEGKPCHWRIANGSLCLDSWVDGVHEGGSWEGPVSWDRASDPRGHEKQHQQGASVGFWNVRSCTAARYLDAWEGGTSDRRADVDDLRGLKR